MATAPFVLSSDGIERFGTEGDDVILVDEPDPGGTLVETFGGNDRIFVGVDNSVVYAGDDDDTYRLLDAEPLYSGGAYYDGGEGDDRLDLRDVENEDKMEADARLLSRVIVDLHKETAGGTMREAGTSGLEPTWNLYLTAVEDVVGTRGADRIKGTVADNRFQGGDGIDLLKGQGGNDKLFGGNGGDKLFDGEGIDNLFGGAGSDIFVLSDDGMADSIKDFEAEYDTIDLSAWGVTSLESLYFRSLDRGQGKLVISFEDETLTIAGMNGAVTEADLTDENLIY